jgi:hypothetical protein
MVAYKLDHALGGKASTQSSAGPRGGSRGAMAESPSEGGAQAKVYETLGPIVH